MKKTMLKATNANNTATAHIVVPSENVDFFKNAFAAANATFEIYEVNEMPLAALPEEVQNEVKKTLKVFNTANVVFEYNRFEVSAHTCIKANYNYDHFVCGRYSADEIYTKEERAKHLAELNGHDIPEWAW